MKALIGIILLLSSVQVFAVCSSPISRNNILLGQIPTSTGYNNDFDNLYTRANSIPGDCFVDGSIREKQIADASLGTTKFADESVTFSKFASGVLPVYGIPLRVRAITTTGTSSWTKGADVGSILVQVVGGGGGSGAYNRAATSGGQSSFGAHCVANGGGGASSTGSDGSAGGAGGTASSGNINLTGGAGAKSNPMFGAGGRSFLGTVGAGAHQTEYQGGGGGGAGGYCAKLIQAIDLADTVTVTVGAGGTYTVAGLAGTNGAVIIYEFGK